MRTTFGGLPRRYPKLLLLSLAAAVLRFVPCIPFCLAYFLPLGVWSKLLVVFSPALWFMVVGPARIRYGEIMAAYTKDEGVPLKVRALFSNDRAWWNTFRGRVQLTYRWALPLAVLLVMIIPLFCFANAFSALKTILNVFIWIASAIATSAAFLPRLMMGEPAVVDAGITGGALALAAALLISICLFVWGVFQTGAYRFGYTRTPKAGDMKPLLIRNLLLWLPTLALFLVFAAFSYKELVLTLSNVLSAAPVFSVKPQLPQIVLAALTAISYCLLLPIRKRNTALWAFDQS